MHAGWGGWHKKDAGFLLVPAKPDRRNKFSPDGSKLSIRRWYSATGAAASGSRVCVGLTAAEQQGVGGNLSEANVCGSAATGRKTGHIPQ